MSLLERVRACAVFDAEAYRPFVVGGEAVGLVHGDFAAALRPFADVFTVSEQAVELSPALSGCEERTSAIDAVLRRLAEDGWVRGWRDEAYDIVSPDRRRILFRMERAAVPRFGLMAFGVHVNGIVGGGGETKMWIGRRSPHKHTAPYKLDQLVAGGIAAGLGVLETLIKEAGEEAKVPAALARLARPAGIVSYRMERPEGLRNDILYLYDLELPADFAPVNTDGELEEFYLWPLRKVIDTVRDTDEFKFNCALVVIDYLVRHGHLSPDDDDYVEIVNGLHRGGH